MSKKLKKFLFVVVFTALLTPLHSLYAQLSSKDSLIYANAINNVIATYHKNIGDQTGKYNGSQNVAYTVSFYEGHPYFFKHELSKGSITYDNVIFENVDLLYDEAKDWVILQDSTHRIQLVSQRLQGFTIFDQPFVRLEKDANTPIVASGFYQLLYDGEIKLYKREVKIITEKFTYSPDLSVLFEKVFYYYIKKGNRFYPIVKKKDFLKILNDKGKEINDFLSAAHLNFRKDKDNTLTKVVAYYDKLNPIETKQ
jgi:hypothetical protein